MAAGGVAARLLLREGLSGAFAGLESSTGLGIPAESRRDTVGAHASALAVVYARCRDDSVVFMAQQKDGTHGYTFIHQAFHAYVAAEATRPGCSPAADPDPGPTATGPHSRGTAADPCPRFDPRHPRGILSAPIGIRPAPYGRLSELLGRVLMLRASRREDRKRVPQYSSS